MQYPIIDNLIYAYLANGWTGLELLPINLWNESWEIGAYSSANGQKVNISDRIRNAEYIIISPDTSYRCTLLATQVYYYDESFNYIAWSIITGSGIFTTTSNARYLNLNAPANYGTTYLNNISINYPSTYTNYISAEETENNINAFKKDISHRLKLQLPHYFPHPVIDALISASDGQQTEKENEILRHYLTPLEIGGI